MLKAIESRLGSTAPTLQPAMATVPSTRPAPRLRQRPSLGERQPLLAVTGLRFCAAFHVYLFHVLAGGASPWGRIVGAGPTAVALFFVLSGFVLAYTYMGDARIDRGRYWLARFARVYPVYLIGVLIPLAVRWVQLLDGTPAGWWKAAKMAVGLSGIGTTLATLFLVQSWHPSMACALNCVGWSLSAEASFYLLFPLVAVVLWRMTVRRALLIGVVAWACSIAMGIAYVATEGRVFAPYLAILGIPFDSGAASRVFAYAPFVHFPEFLVGVAAGRIFLTERGVLAESRLNWDAMAGITALVIIGVYAFSPALIAPIVTNGGITPLFVILIASVALSRRAVATLLGNPLAVTLGGMSYALYILHPAIVSGTRGLFLRLSLSPSSSLSFVAQLGATMVLSYSAFRWIEEPARRRLRHFGGGGR